MGEMRLKWHFRSKHEKLIAFSNYQYYNGELITFPSPNTLDDSVKFVWVDGIYDAGKSRTNQKEAEAVVAAIIEHYVSGKGATLSIGVITFNVAQRDLIENLLDAARVALDECLFSLKKAHVDALERASKEVAAMNGGEQ